MPDAVLSNLYAFLLFLVSDLVDQSCFTSTVTSLSAGDQVFLQLQDLHRRVNANEGKTFWGLLRLNWFTWPFDQANQDGTKYKEYIYFLLLIHIELWQISLCLKILQKASFSNSVNWISMIVLRFLETQIFQHHGIRATQGSFEFLIFILQIRIFQIYWGTFPTHHTGSLVQIQIIQIKIQIIIFYGLSHSGLTFFEPFFEFSRRVDGLGNFL